ncbi:MAG TPA: hypothetical protein VM537_15045 [Anaerolineae bacterium]|nr:hypothetical protein [Anaerolineae bacterium]
MRTIEEIRADWDLVEDESADWGPIELAEERLYNDIPDVLAALGAKDTEIERLRNIARLAGNLTDRLAEINLATDNARAIAAAMQYGKETAALAEALTEVGE